MFYSVLSDGPPIVASGSPQGHIAFWDLERRQLAAQQRHAHRTAVAGATFLHGEPLLVTNGADNAIKVRRSQTEDLTRKASPHCGLYLRCGYLTKKGAEPDCCAVDRVTVPRPLSSVTMATMARTS